MKNQNNTTDVKPVVIENIPLEITEADQNIFFDCVSTDINEGQEERVVAPELKYPRQKNVLAIHWHPEFVPILMVKKRIENMFPNKEKELIIPTQHNEFTEYGEYSGVEVDCYSKGFNQKVQLLLHFKTENLDNADVLKAMIKHTFQYRSTQLFEYINAVIKPDEDRIDKACRQTGADNDMVRFSQMYVKKISDLIEQNITSIKPQMIKNKIIRDFMDGLRLYYNGYFIDRVQTFLKAVKQIVKEDFSLHYFYRTSEFIEEARSHGAGIVVPHPEQFWPIIMANYDVDGVEVWNPQSQRYTKFLISVINHQNKSIRAGEKPLLIFMGDDTHMSEKIRDPKVQNVRKASREIGYQPAWDDFSIRKELIQSSINRPKLIEEYRSRLNG